MGDGGGDPHKLREDLQRAMTAGAGVLRSADSLATTSRLLDDLGRERGPLTPSWCELHNLVSCARALLAAATARRESRGAHTRADFPQASESFCHRIVL